MIGVELTNSVPCWRLGRGNKMVQGFSAAAAGHVFERRMFEDAGIHQRLANASGRAVPTAAGTAGNQKMDFFRNEFGRSRSRHQHRHQDGQDDKN